MPSPIVIDFDRGLSTLVVDSIRGPETWSDTLALLRAIADKPHGKKSLIIDTVDPLETLATAYVCQQAGKKTLGDFTFGAGYEALAGEWRLMLAELDRTRAAGLTVLLLAHSQVKTVRDPQLGDYDSTLTQLQKKTWAQTSRWCDCIFFACFDSARVPDERRAIVTGERVVHTTAGSGFYAKNRYSMPARLPLSWAAMDAAMRARTESADAVRERVRALAHGTEFAEKAAAFLADAGEDVMRLMSIENALKERVQSHE